MRAIATILKDLCLDQRKMKKGELVVRSPIDGSEIARSPTNCRWPRESDSTFDRD